MGWPGVVTGCLRRVIGGFRCQLVPPTWCDPLGPYFIPSTIPSTIIIIIISIIIIIIVVSIMIIMISISIIIIISSSSLRELGAPNPG